MSMELIRVNTSGGHLAAYNEIVELMPRASGYNGIITPCNYRIVVRFSIFVDPLLRNELLQAFRTFMLKEVVVSYSHLRRGFLLLTILPCSPKHVSH